MASESRVFERDGAKVVVDEVSLPFIDGSHLDFVSELIGQSFRIVDNPIADSGCGCGVSFNLNPSKMDAGNPSPNKEF